MALEGTLRDFSLADIFQLIGIQKKTGVLTLEHQGEVVTVSFLNGNVVSADSLKKNLEDRLGTVLVKSGRISEARLHEALKIQKETLQRLGYVLVQSGYIDEEDLKEALRLQITQIVYRLFRWRDGQYHFSQEETVEYDREHFTPLTAESILMEGIRMIDEWPIIERKIPSFDMVFRKARQDALPVVVTRREDDLSGSDLASALAGADEAEAHPPEGTLRLAQEEAAVYDQVDGRRSVQEIIDRVRMGDFETCRILYELLSRNLIAPAAGAPATHATPRPGWVGPLLEKMAYLALCSAVAVSLLTMGRSPFSGSPRLLASPSALDQINELICRNRIERIDEAIQVYYLQKGFYPDDLKDLVTGGLVRETTLRDPWGRSFGFISSTEGYRLIAYDAGGVENQGRSLARGRIHLPRVQPLVPGGDAARLSPGSSPQTPR